MSRSMPGEARHVTTEIDRVAGHLRNLEQLSPDYIMIVDRELVVRYINRTAAKQFGKNVREMNGKYLQLFFPDPVCGTLIARLRGVFRSGTAVTSTDQVPFPGAELLLHIKWVPVRELSGSLSGVLLIARDISELRRSAPLEQDRVNDAALLSDREAEVLALIAEGMTNKEVGETLFISPKTVDAHRTRIMKKLDAHNTAELIRRSRQTGLLL